jgi:hypothetical protein
VPELGDECQEKRDSQNGAAAQGPLAGVCGHGAVAGPL